MAISEKNTIWLAGIAFALVAYFSQGYHHFDEHFQVLEFAWFKLGFTQITDLAWEYEARIRPTIQPSMAVVMYKGLSFFGVTSPFALALSLRILSGLLAFISIHMLFKLYKPTFSERCISRLFLFFSFFLWFMMYNSLRFSSENWAAIFFVFGFVRYMQFKSTSFLNYLGIGVLFGLAFLFRFQTALMFGGLMAWMLIVKREKLTSLLAMAFGIGSSVGLGFLIDRWFYGEWTNTAWNYFAWNILDDRASSFGTHPWYDYFLTFFLEGMPPVSLVVILAVLTLVIFQRKNPLVWIVVPFVLVHMLIGHKELRFMFPLATLVPIILVQGIEFWNNKLSKGLIGNPYFKSGLATVIGVNIIFVLVVCFRAADHHTNMYQTIYENYEEPQKLYYVKDNPYYRVLNVHVYRRPSLDTEDLLEGTIPQTGTKV
jgi:phosphatidylinositol glycan class B